MLSAPFILKPMEPRVWSPAPGGSILITSAPRSASSMQAYGPAITWLMSSTRTPARGSGSVVLVCRVTLSPFDAAFLDDLRPLLDLGLR